MDVLVYNTHLFGDTPAALVAGAHDRRRALAIAERVLEDPPDLALLSEVWAPSTRSLIAGRLAPALPHAVDDGRRHLASGLLALSRWPVAASGFTPYEACAGTGCLSEKGWLWLVIERPEGRLLVLLSHTQAGSRPVDRAARAAHLAALSAARADLGARWAPALTVVAGDLNTAERDAGLPDPGDEYARLTQAMAGLVDAWAAVGDGPGLTYDALTNPWIRRFAPAEHRGVIRQRLDYLWTDGVPRAASLPVDTFRWRRADGSWWPLSDHEPLRITLDD